MAWGIYPTPWPPSVTEMPIAATELCGRWSLPSLQASTIETRPQRTRVAPTEAPVKDMHICPD
jgi:hypothetical protein